MSFLSFVVLDYVWRILGIIREYVVVWIYWNVEFVFRELHV